MRWKALLGGVAISAGCMTDDGRLTVGIVVAAAGALAAGGGGYYYRGREQASRRAAFATCDEALLTTLGLCVHGVQIVPCEASAPPGRPASR